MFCTNCGSPVPDAANFCTACGSAVQRTPDHAGRCEAPIETPQPVRAAGTSPCPCRPPHTRSDLLPLVRRRNLRWSIELPALWRQRKSASNTQRIRLGRTARPQGHGQAPVRRFVLPDRRPLRSGGRRQPRGLGQHLLHAPRSAVERSAVEHHHHVAGSRMEAHVCRTAADHDAGARPRPHRILARRARRNDRASAAARRRGGRARAPVHAGHQQRRLRLVLHQHLVHHAIGRRQAKRTIRSACSWIAFPRRKRPDCCCCTPRAMCSCAIWRPARPFS